MALIIDAGVLLASIDRRDAHHHRCRNLLEATRETLLAPAPVLPEVDYLLARAGQPAGMITLLQEIGAGRLRVLDLEVSDYARSAELIDRYTDLDIGFVDAAVLAVTERLGEPKLATLDHRHFSVMRPRHVDALDLVP